MLNLVALLLQLIHHMYKICKEIECVCKDDDKIYEVS